MREPEILYSDGDYAVAVKPYGMLSEGEMPRRVASLLGIPEDSVYTVHRLDRTTEGLIVYALNRSAAARLSALIAEGGMTKEYDAFIPDGTGLPESGTMSDLLYFDRRLDKSFVVDRDRRGAKRAELEYRLYGPVGVNGTEFVRVHVILHTGRTHQIRVQFGSRKAPLAGDGKYGSRIKFRGPSLFSSAVSFTWDGETKRYSIEDMVTGMFGEAFAGRPDSLTHPTADSIIVSEKQAGNGRTEIHEMAKVIVETSARHVHVTKEHLAILFGEDHKLTHKKDLSQPGQFACEERVTLVGPKKSIPNVSILGPERSATQVEVSFTDARTLGLTPPVRESGDIAGSAGCKIVGPEGEIEITEGVIVAKRHIHLTPADAEEFGVEDKQIVSVKIDTEGRSLVFGDVVIRVSPKFAAAMHIDTDEANAACAFGNVYGEIIK